MDIRPISPAEAPPPPPTPAIPPVGERSPDGSTRWAGWAATALLALIGIPRIMKWWEWIWIIDDFDLMVHEAGHPLFHIFGYFIGIAGGTLLQLIVPSAFIIAFLRQRQPLSVAVCVWWLGVNFLYVGRYMADARAQVLPLIGDGTHDFFYLFSRMGLLKFDRVIGGLTHALGSALMLGAILFCLAPAHRWREWLARLGPCLEDLLFEKPKRRR